MRHTFLGKLLDVEAAEAHLVMEASNRGIADQNSFLHISSQSKSMRRTGVPLSAVGLVVSADRESGALTLSGEDFCKSETRPNCLGVETGRLRGGGDSS